MKLAHRIAFVTTVTTVVLIGLGAFVRATGSGLGCPDWPLCYESVLPADNHKSVIEVVHRYLGTVVGILIISTAIAVWRSFRHVPFLLLAATLAVPVVGIQGFLGGLTVLAKLRPEVVALHLLNAMIVLTLLLCVTIGTALENPDNARQVRQFREAPARTLGMLASGALLLLFAAMWFGGYLGESGASTACADWPLCNGSSILPSTNTHEVVHMAHRVLAGSLVFYVIPLLVLGWRKRNSVPWALPFVGVLGVLYFTQVTVGALNVWYVFPDPLTVTHTAVAAFIWVTLAAGAILTYYPHGPSGWRRNRSGK